MFFTSFLLADQVLESGCYGATSLVLSSASSKTAYATAFELRGRGPRLVGLTSPGNVAFTRSLGCYDDVLPYDDIGTLERAPTAYLDLSGAPDTRAALRRHLGGHLVRDVVVGVTHQVTVAGAGDEVFFAPGRMRRRAGDWGRDGLDGRLAEAWRRFAAVVDDWVDVRVASGPDGLQHAWMEILQGRTPPRVGQIIQL